MYPRPDFQQLCFSKLKSSGEFRSAKNHLQQFGKKIVFTNGCFDILHRGHLEYLMKAAEMGDHLVIGLNTDASVKRLNKSPERPINNEHTRAFQLGALWFVNTIILFDEDTPEILIREVEPDVLVKGGDYDAGEKNKQSKKFIIGSDFTMERGGKVVTIPLVEGYSTTSLINKMKNNP